MSESLASNNQSGSAKHALWAVTLSIRCPQSTVQNEGWPPPVSSIPGMAKAPPYAPVRFLGWGSCRFPGNNLHFPMWLLFSLMSVPLTFEVRLAVV